MRKFAKIGIVILSILIVGLVINKVSFNKTENDSNLISIIKQELLKSENETNGNAIKGSLYNDETSAKITNTELVLYKMSSTNEFIKQDVTYTSGNGSYTFQNLDVGTYKINLSNNDEYKLVNDNYEFEITSDTTINNVDLKASKTELFKAQITKYIKEVILNVNGKENVYTFDKKNRVNIPVKNLNNLSGEVIFEFDITNNKTKDGYVKVIKDILPEGLSFNKAKNETWKEKNGILYNTSLSNEILKVGQTKTILLTLDINNTNEAKSYLNKVSITGEVYHKVEFISFDEVVSKMEVLDGDTAIKENNLSKDGYVFKGWYKDNTLNEKFDFTSPITEDTKIYAHWVKQHTVNYIVDNSVYKTEIVQDKDLTTKPEVDPSKEGYKFVDWYTDENYTNKFDFNTKIVSDTNIFAKFEETIKYYNVTYILEGKEYAKETLIQGSLIENKEVPEKENKETIGKVNVYEFSGWYIDESYSALFNFDKGITSDITLYGKYDESKVCKTISNVNIPTRESILNEIKSSEEIINEVEKDYQQVNINNAEIHDNFAITDDFVAELKPDNKYEIVQYKGINKEIIIPDTIDNIDVTSINGIFNNITIDKIKISKTLKEIKSSFNSSTIGDIDFEDSINLTSISSSLNGLIVNQINFGNAVSLSYIESSFQGDTIKVLNLNNARSLSNLEFVRAMTISDSIDFGNAISVTEIPAGFLSHKEIKSVDFSNAIGLTTIKQGAFVGVTIYDLSFGNTIGLTTIETEAFSGAYTQDGGILNIDFGNSINLSDIQADSFRAILNVDVLDMSKLFGLKDLSSYAIRHNTLIKKVIFSTSIETIDNMALYNNNIEELDLSCAVNLKVIKDEAFSHNNITNAVLENLPSLTTLELGAFGYNPLEKFILKNLDFLVNVTASINAYSSFNYENDPKYVPKSKSEFVIDNIGATDLYFRMYAPFFSKVVIQNNKKLVNLGSPYAYDGSMFQDQSNYNTDDGRLKEIVIQNNEQLKTINKVLFEVDVHSIILQNLPSLISISDQAFYYSTIFVDQIVLRDFPNLEYIGNEAFGLTGSGSNTTINGKIVSKLNSIVLSSLPKLRTIGESSFNVWGASTLTLDDLPSLITIGNFAFAGHRAENIVLNSENVPMLTTLGNESFWPYSDYDNGIKSNLKSIEVTDLPNLDTVLPIFIGSVGRGQNYIELETLTFRNLPLIDTIMISTSGVGNPTFSSGYSTIKNISIENLQKLDLSTINNNFMGLGIENITLANLPSTTIIPEYNFAENNIKYLDLTRMGNLQEIKNQAFRSKTLEIIKLPETLTTIGYAAFDDGSGRPSDTITCVELQGDSSRFYGDDVLYPGMEVSYWEYIGLSSDIIPGTCTIPTNTDISSSSLLENIAANILGLNTASSSSATYSLVLYKLDDKSLIDNSSIYKLTKLIDEDYNDIKVLEDIENVGRYSISSSSNDSIKPFNNKIYLTNVEPGVYKLVNVSDNNKVLTFIVDNDGTLTGYAKINNVSNTDTIMSFSEAELITSIQTGGSKPLYIILIGLLLFIIILLFILKRRKEIKVN